MIKLLYSSVVSINITEFFVGLSLIEIAADVS